MDHVKLGKYASQVYMIQTQFLCNSVHGQQCYVPLEMPVCVLCIGTKKPSLIAQIKSITEDGISRVLYGKVLIYQ